MTVRRAYRALALALVGVVSLAGVTAAQAPLPPVLSAEQRQLLERAFDALDSAKADEGRRLVNESRDRLAAKVFRWVELQQPRSGASFEDIAAFIDANPDWPNHDILYRRAEEALVERTDDSVVLAWFALRGPTTADGAMRYIEALTRSGNRARAYELIRETWIGGEFGGAQEAAFLKRYRQHLEPNDHIRRLDRLVWEGRREDARRQMARVNEDWKALADARLRLQAMSGGVDGALRKVPPHLVSHPGLQFERMRWRRKKNQEEGVREILREAPADLGRADLWWNERAYMVRRSVSAGRMTEAYVLAKDHGLSGGAGLAEAEFLAGWVALRFLDRPEPALVHFKRLHEVARFPVTQARAAYWAGRAAAALGDVKESQTWYERAAVHVTTYYGQIAATAMNNGGSAPPLSTPTPTAEERQTFERSELVRAARLLNEINQPQRVKAFITRLVLNAKTSGEHTLASELATRLKRPDLAVSAAKRSAQVAGVSIPDHGWPTIDLQGGNPPERALVLATIRQESAFETDAVSRAGARGLMQLIPPTARAMAKQLNLPSNNIEKRLLADPSLNLRLGRAYLAGLIDDYDGSYLLAVAAYNAGPGRVQRWLKDNGDPRKPHVDAIDWIELIPIDETRNYVQRVFENLQVYRYRLNGRPVDERIDRDLRRRRTAELTP
jgi:soluble lytic murein transglycosylase